MLESDYFVLITFVESMLRSRSMNFAVLAASPIVIVIAVHVRVCRQLQFVMSSMIQNTMIFSKNLNINMCRNGYVEYRLKVYQCLLFLAFVIFVMTCLQISPVNRSPTKKNMVGLVSETFNAKNYGVIA